ncbi:hypothetical protein NQ318_023475, partial [Aromia moschata]
MRSCVLCIGGELSEIIAAEMNRNKNNRCWVRKWLCRREIYGASSTLLRELAEEYVPEYRNWLRMSKEQFELLLAQIAPQISKNNTVMRSAIPARIKMEITLSYLATGNCFRTLQRLFRVSRVAISKFVPEMCDAIYESQRIYKVIENGLLPDGGFIVGDDAFPLIIYLMKPYLKVALSEEHTIFNYRLSPARRIVENAFRILVSRFRIFEKPVACLAQTVYTIIKACCAIHNYLRIISPNTYKPSGSLDEEYIESCQIRLGSWRNETNTSLPPIRTLGSNQSSRFARELRDRVCPYFMGEGAVPWQQRM